VARSGFLASRRETAVTARDRSARSIDQLARRSHVFEALFISLGIVAVGLWGYNKFVR
jgi:hypothetical protein